VRAAYLTPAHQHPLGSVLPEATRRAVLDWARQADGYVVEDDYDSELRYEVAPTPAMASVDPDRVVFLGTASKTVAAALRLGWLVGPANLLAAIVERRRQTHDIPAWPSQLAFRSMLQEGHVGQLVRSARARYADQADRVVARFTEAGLRSLLPAAPAGTYVTLELPQATAETVVRAAERAGFALPSLETYARGVPRHGIVLGFGGCRDEAELERVLDVVIATILAAGATP